MGLARQGRRDRLDLPGGHRQQLHLRRALEQHRDHAGLLDARTGGQQAVVGEQDGALVAEGGGDDLAFLVAYRHARPVLEEGAVVV